MAGREKSSAHASTTHSFTFGDSEDESDDDRPASPHSTIATDGASFCTASRLCELSSSAQFWSNDEKSKLLRTLSSFCVIVRGTVEPLGAPLLCAAGGKAKGSSASPEVIRCHMYSKR